MQELTDLEKALEQGLEKWQEQILMQNAKRMGQRMLAEIVRETPVDTGMLRRTWTSQVNKIDGDILIHATNPTEYAAAVNDGHRIVRGGKTVGFKDGKKMAEKGIVTYQDTYLANDVDKIWADLREATK